MSIAKTFLGLLESGPRHGYDLKRAYDERFGPRPAARLRPGLRDAVAAAQERPGVVDGVEPGDGPSASATRSPTTASPTSSAGSASPSARPVPAEHALRQGRARAADRPPGRRHPRRPARRAPRPDARADPPQGRRRPRRPAHLRPRPVPPRGRPALAGADRRAPRRPARARCRREAARLEPQIEPRRRRDRAPLLAATDVRKSFGATPALRRRVDSSSRAGEIVAVMGPSGLRQVDAAALPGRASSRPTADGRCTAARDLARMSDRARSRAAAHGVRLRLPVRPARARAELPARTSRCRCAWPASTRRRRGARARPSGSSGSRSPTSPSTAPGEVSGGQAPARRRRPRARHRPARDLRRRADRRARLAQRRARHASCSPPRARETAAAVVLVTHEPRVAAYADREVIVRDGRTTTR